MSPILSPVVRRESEADGKPYFYKEKSPASCFVMYMYVCIFKPYTDLKPVSSHPRSWFAQGQPLSACSRTVHRVGKL